MSRNHKVIADVFENVLSGNAVSNDTMVNFAVHQLPFGGIGGI
jgi:delta 1-pyrroline-5-carboxylate dehydrogenase